MKNLLGLVFGITLITLLISGVYAEQQSLPPQIRNSVVNLPQSCLSSSYANITRIIVYPSGTYLIDSQISMQKNGDNYNYSFSQTSELGTYYVYGNCDELGTKVDWVYNFEVTTNGTESGEKGYIIIGLLGFGILLFGLGRIFNTRKWKLKMFFDISSLIMFLLLLNTIKIIYSVNEDLASMLQISLVIGIVMVSIMMMYAFINFTIELVQYFKSKKKTKWSMNDYAK